MIFQRPSIRFAASVQSAVYTALVRRGHRGQATAEYTLVMLGAAAVALLVISWATKTSKVSTLLNKVVEKITNQVA